MSEKWGVLGDLKKPFNYFLLLRPRNEKKKSPQSVGYQSAPKAKAKASGPPQSRSSPVASPLHTATCCCPPAQSLVASRR